MNKDEKKLSLGNKIAFACGDIFGGGSFNVINFLFVEFLTLVVGLPMTSLAIVLLLTKIWDGIIDPFIGNFTDGITPGKFGKRRICMIVAAPFVFLGFVLLFFPWNLLGISTVGKMILVIISYMFYATAQSFVLIPYYSHASELTEDYVERNRANALRLCFSIASSLICVVVPSIIANPQKNDNGYSYILMAILFGALFTVSIVITAVFSHEQVVYPAVKRKFSLKEFVKPLQCKTYRQYLGMQMCASMSMAVMSSFFITFFNFYLRNESYGVVMNTADASFKGTPATVAIALMFVAQIVAMPLYLKLIKLKGKRFAYITSAVVWIAVIASVWLLPQETSSMTAEEVALAGGLVVPTSGTPNWLVMAYGVLLGMGVCGTVFVPHSSFGDVCDVGELYFGERTEGAFSGLTNFLNTTAQALGLFIAPLIVGLAGYKETDYMSVADYVGQFGATDFDSWQQTQKGVRFFINGGYRYNYYGQDVNIQYQPITQPVGAQVGIKITFVLVPIIVLVLGIVIASRFKLSKSLQQQIVEANALDHDSEEYKNKKEELLSQL